MSPPPAAAQTVISREGRTEHLPELLAFVDTACARVGLDRGVALEVHLAVEEVCANIIRHGYTGPVAGPIRIGFRRSTDRVVITISDDAPTFSPGDAPAADLTADWQDRRVGGLGWHLVFQFVDEVHHKPGPRGGNHLTLVKHLQPSAGTASSSSSSSSSS